MRAFWLVIGAIAGALGALFIIGDGPKHAVCSSALTASSSSCQSTNYGFYTGVVLLVAGVGLMIIAMLINPAPRGHTSVVPTTSLSHTGPTAWPPGWYMDPGSPRAERWWDGQAWTSESREATSPSGSTPPVT